MGSAAPTRATATIPQAKLYTQRQKTPSEAVVVLDMISPYHMCDGAYTNIRLALLNVLRHVEGQVVKTQILMPFHFSYRKKSLITSTMMNTPLRGPWSKATKNKSYVAPKVMRITKNGRDS